MTKHCGFILLHLGFLLLFPRAFGAEAIQILSQSLEEPLTTRQQECLERQKTILQSLPKVADTKTLFQDYLHELELGSVPATDLNKLLGDPEALRKHKALSRQKHATITPQLDATIEGPQSSSPPSLSVRLSPDQIGISLSLSKSPCTAFSRTDIYKKIREQQSAMRKANEARAAEFQVSERKREERAKEEAAEREAQRLRAEEQERARAALERLQLDATECAQRLSTLSPLARLDLFDSMRELNPLLPNYDPDAALSFCTERGSPSLRVSGALAAFQEELQKILAGLRPEDLLATALIRGDEVLARFTKALGARASGQADLEAFGLAEAQRMLSDFRFSLAVAAEPDPVEKAKLLGKAQESVFAAQQALAKLPPAQRKSKYPEALKRLTESDLNIAISLGRIPTTDERETVSGRTLRFVRQATARARQSSLAPSAYEAAQLNALELDAFLTQIHGDIGSSRARLDADGDHGEYFENLIAQSRTGLAAAQNSPDFKLLSSPEQLQAIGLLQLTTQSAMLSASNERTRRDGMRSILQTLDTMGASSEKKAAVLYSLFQNHLGTSQGASLIELAQKNGIDSTRMRRDQRAVSEEFNASVAAMFSDGLAEKFKIPTLEEMLESKDGAISREFHALTANLGHVGSLASRVRENDPSVTLENLDDAMIGAEMQWISMKCFDAARIAKKTANDEYERKRFLRDHAISPFENFKPDFSSCFDKDLEPSDVNQTILRVSNRAIDRRLTRQKALLIGEFGIDAALAVGSLGVGTAVKKGVTVGAKAVGKQLMRRVAVNAALGSTRRAVVKTGVRLGSTLAQSALTGFTMMELEAVKDLTLTRATEGRWDWAKLSPAHLTPERLALGALGTVSGRVGELGLGYLSKGVGRLWRGISNTPLARVQAGIGATAAALSAKKGFALLNRAKQATQEILQESAKRETSERLTAVLQGDFSNATDGSDPFNLLEDVLAAVARRKLAAKKVAITGRAVLNSAQTSGRNLNQLDAADYEEAARVTLDEATRAPDGEAAKELQRLDENRRIFRMIRYEPGELHDLAQCLALSF